jgi:hypothetical protein
MPEEHLSRLSHFCPDLELATDAVNWRWVGYQSSDPKALADDVAVVFQRVSSDHVRRAARAMRCEKGTPVPTMLSGYGVEVAGNNDHDELHVWASRIVAPIASALAIIMQHPDVGVLIPQTHHQIQLMLAQLTRIIPLWTYISKHPPGTGADPWYVQTICKDASGNPLRPAEDIKDKNGKLIVWPQQDGQSVIAHFELADTVAPYATPVIQDAIRLVKQEPSLKGVKWTTQHGVTVKDRTTVDDVARTSAEARRLSKITAPAADWTLKNTTSQYGLVLYPETLNFDQNAGQISFDVKNWPNRCLGVHHQALDANNNPLGTRTYLQTIGSGDTVFGIPVDLIAGGVTTLQIPVPAGATQLKVFLGGIGQGERDIEVDSEGILATAILSYGVPSMLSVMSVGVQASSIYMSIFKGPMAMGVIVGLGKIIFEQDLSPTHSYSIGKTLSYAAEVVAGILFNKGLVFATVKLVAYITGEEILDNVPWVGWVSRLASLAAAVLDMVATSAEVGQSPWSYILEAKRSMALQVTVSPDPTHGTSTQKPVWPKVSDHWIITVQYKGGTTLRKAGPRPGDYDTTISVLFSKATNDELPSAPGETFQITAAVYSADNWLAGQWISGWVEAVPTDGDGRSESGSIIEQLVPLTASTNYYQQEKLSYDGPSSSYVWSNIIFSLPDTLESSLQSGQVQADVIAAFWSKGVRLSAQTTIAIMGDGHWLVTDAGDVVTYDVARQSIIDPNSGTVIGYELEVKNVTHPSPAGTEPDLAKQDVSDLVDITNNDLAYKVGYCYQARNQNLPADSGQPATTTNDPMYMLQSISSLANPAAGMKTPTRGFTSMSNISYDQFGPSGLFELQPAENYLTELNNFTTAGPVPADIATVFTNRSYPLPAGAAIVVVTASASWRISGADGKPIYDLRRQIDVIKVFNAPAPEFSPNNFYLDSRTFNTDGAHHLRLIDLHDDSGPTFDYDSKLSWGAFTMTNLDAIAIHPNGFAVGITYEFHQLAILKLPEKGVAEADAPRAIPMTGEGVREGLMQGPVGMTITSDGRILVLERTGARIQAFDSFGNPTQCFAAELNFDLSTDFAKELDNATASLALLQALQKSVPVLNNAPGAFDKRYLSMPLFNLDPGFVAVLDAGTFTQDLRTQFESHAVTLSAKVTITPTSKGSLWIISDEEGINYDVRLNGEGQSEVDVYRAMTPMVSVKAPGAEWTIMDKTNTLTFDVKQQKATSGNGNVLHFVRLQALMRLKTGTSTAIVYLDVAVESKGFIYVLLYTKPASGPLKPGDYRLDIYNPDGTPVSADVASNNGIVNGARITVDQWRTLFTLNYEQMLGAGGRPEPTISQWIPTTPGAQ